MSLSTTNSFDNIIEKLSNNNEQEKLKETVYIRSRYKNQNEFWSNWSLLEKKKVLELYFLISKKESYIFDLIYNYHGCDSWEHIFRDYNINKLEEKTDGVDIALQTINRIIEESKEN